MRRPPRVALGVLAAALLAGACGGTAGAARSHPSPAASAAAGAGTLAAWRQKGATEVPPASLRRVSLGAVQVVNQTAGAVSDADAMRWATAYLRGNGYELWAWDHLQDGFLRYGGLSRAPQAAFGADLTSIDQARAAGATVDVTRLRLRRLVLRPVPQSLSGLETSYGFVWTSYAFFLDQIGPSDVTWVDGYGHRTVQSGVQAGVFVPELVGGQLVDDPLMGEVWSQDSDWSCSPAASRQTLGSLCTA